MAKLVIFAALASILATALLTWLLWRINLGKLGESAPQTQGAAEDED